ncbi:2-haloacid dehalogenase [Stella humosa]|uniref:(S)-2-haloacid dehalogenase n=1 Tax=Stella humosa TaxID=94 RepID=A0A3N1MLG0_9PROT|nr:haloacid dehalogenase type II [Stella humosa]ROQ01826.1 2-haloacid dehalogenase [Stella humosa]BBK32213.1 haloacid dehalogenase [Stella humosa]
MGHGIKALVFDVFGTLVDWRNSVAREGEAWGGPRGLKVDWYAFADAWRGAYHPSMDKVRKGERPWTILDILHRETLDRLLDQFGITGLTEDEKDHWNRVWHRLTPWPDTVPGLLALKPKFILATASNGNVGLLLNMAKNAGMPFDTILSAELCQHYKPDPVMYRSLYTFLGLKPHEVLMTAAHNSDLVAASKQGLSTAFFPRPTEYGPAQEKDKKAEHDFTFVATDLIDLARQLRAI